MSASSGSGIGSGEDGNGIPANRRHASHQHLQQHSVLRDKILHQFMKRGNTRRKDLLEEYRRKQHYNSTSSSPTTSVSAADYPHVYHTAHIHTSSSGSNGISNGQLAIVMPPYLTSPGALTSSEDVIHQYIQENFLQYVPSPSTFASPSNSKPSAHMSALDNASPLSFPLPSPTRSVSFSSDINHRNPVHVNQHQPHSMTRCLADWESFFTSDEYEDLYLHIEDCIRQEAELGDEDNENLPEDGAGYTSSNTFNVSNMQVEHSAVHSAYTPSRSMTTPSPYARSQSYSPFERSSALSSNASIEATCDLNESMTDWEACYEVDDFDTEEVIICPICWRDTMRLTSQCAEDRATSISPFSAHSGSAFSGYDLSDVGNMCVDDDPAAAGAIADADHHLLLCSCGAVIDLTSTMFQSVLTVAELRQLLSDSFDRHSAFCSTASDSSMAMATDNNAATGDFQCRMMNQGMIACCSKCGFAEQVF